MKRAIGGYFELELPKYKEYHANALKLNSGKNCLEYLLCCRKYRKVYIPYYTCDVILKPFQKLGIAYQFYHINLQFEIADEIELQEGEALLYTNYYGLKQRYVEKMVGRYGERLIIDNTQAFFAKPMEGIDTFYTCRKFFGVSDGAYLYTNATPIEELKQSTSYHTISHLIKRIDLSPEEGFEDYHRNEENLEHEEIMLMSCFTERMMQSIDYKAVAERRRENFQHLHETLQSSNLLAFKMENDAVPMIYPYMSGREVLRDYLIQNKVYVARYWPNVLEWTEKDSVENRLANMLLPLPIDQRYDEREMDSIINKLRSYE